MHRIIAISAISFLSLLFAVAPTIAADIEIKNAWSRATSSTSTTGAVYLSIKAANHNDKLIGAKSAIARRIELHKIVEINNKARMQAVPYIDLPVGQFITLKPHDFHIMLIDLESPLKAGNNIELELLFENNLTKKILVPIKPASYIPSL